MIGRTGDARGAFIGNTIKLIWEASHAQALRDHRVFSPAMKLTGLRRHPVFGGLPLEHIERLSTCASTRAYPRGAGRLAKQLLHLIGGVEGSGGDRKVSMTQRELGEMIGMSRESTNKQLRETVLAPEALAAIGTPAIE